VLDQTQHNLCASEQACREKGAAIKVNGDSIQQLKANLAKERQNRQALEATLTQERQKRLAPIASSERLLPVEVEHLQIMVMSAKRDKDQLQEDLNKTQERKRQLECDLATIQAETKRSRLDMEHKLATLQASINTQRADIIAMEDVADANDRVISALQADRILLLCVVDLASTLIWTEKYNELGKATRQQNHWQLEAAFWKQECDILAHKCDQIKQEQGHAEATIGNLKTRHKEEKRHSNDRFAKMQQTIADRETAIKTLKDVVTNMVSQLADLRQVVLDRDGTIRRQEESQASVQAQITTLQQEIISLSSNNVQLEAEEQVLSTEILNLSANLCQVTDVRDTAISENNKTRIAVRQQVNELMERKTPKQAMKTEIRCLTCTVDAHDAQMKTAQHHWQKSYSHMETRFYRKLTKARRMIGGGPYNESLRHHHCNIPSKPLHDFHCGDKQHSFFATDFDYPIGDHGEKFLFRPEKADSGLDHISANEDDASNSSNASTFLYFDDKFGGFPVGDDPSNSADGIVDVTVAFVRLFGCCSDVARMLMSQD
jgi:chromosome segregation ATPase